MPQNFAPDGFKVLQCRHCSPKLLPHSAQNKACFFILAPHSGQKCKSVLISCLSVLLSKDLILSNEFPQLQQYKAFTLLFVPHSEQNLKSILILLFSSILNFLFYFINIISKASNTLCKIPSQCEISRTSNSNYGNN